MVGNFVHSALGLQLSEMLWWTDEVFWQDWSKTSKGNQRICSHPKCWDLEKFYLSKMQMYDKNISLPIEEVLMFSHWEPGKPVVLSLSSKLKASGPWDPWFKSWNSKVGKPGALTSRTQNKSLSQLSERYQFARYLFSLGLCGKLDVAHQCWGQVFPT